MGLLTNILGMKKRIAPVPAPVISEQSRLIREQQRDLGQAAHLIIERYPNLDMVMDEACEAANRIGTELRGFHLVYLTDHYRNEWMKRSRAARKKIAARKNRTVRIVAKPVFKRGVQPRGTR